MKVLFISRKKASGIGGLARFFQQLTFHFPEEKYILSPDHPFTFLRLPFISFDLIHLCDATLLPLGVFLKLLFGKPLTVTAHGLDLTFPNPLYKLMLKFFLPKADVVILDSLKAKKLVKKFMIDDYKIHVIPPGISVDHFKKTEQVKLHRLWSTASFLAIPIAERNPAGYQLVPCPVPSCTRWCGTSTGVRSLASKGKIVLVTVGNLVSRKGHLWFIENVLKHLTDDYIYLIVGDGPEKKRIKALIKNSNLKDRVYLLGRLKDTQCYHVLKHSNIYVCPNIKREGDFEGFGIAAGEAAAMGLPVVASNVDGIGKVIKHNKNGWLVEPKPSEFISAIEKLKEAKLRKKLGEKAKRYTLENYSWQRTVIQYRKIFKKITM